MRRQESAIARVSMLESETSAQNTHRASCSLLYVTKVVGTTSSEGFLVRCVFLAVYFPEHLLCCGSKVRYCHAVS